MTGKDTKLSQLSGILHVYLLNPDNKIQQSINLQLTNGMGAGDFAFAEGLRTVRGFETRTRLAEISGNSHMEAMRRASCARWVRKTEPLRRARAK